MFEQDPTPNTEKPSTEAKIDPAAETARLFINDFMVAFRGDDKVPPPPAPRGSGGTVDKASIKAVPAPPAPGGDAAAAPTAAKPQAALTNIPDTITINGLVFTDTGNRIYSNGNYEIRITKVGAPGSTPSDQPVQIQQPQFIPQGQQQFIPQNQQQFAGTGQQFIPVNQGFAPNYYGRPGYQPIMPIGGNGNQALRQLGAVATIGAIATGNYPPNYAYGYPQGGYGYPQNGYAPGYGGGYGGYGGGYGGYGGGYGGYGGGYGGYGGGYGGYNPVFATAAGIMNIANGNTGLGTAELLTGSVFPGYGYGYGGLGGGLGGVGGGGLFNPTTGGGTGTNPFTPHTSGGTGTGGGFAPMPQRETTVPNVPVQPHVPEVKPVKPEPEKPKPHPRPRPNHNEVIQPNVRPDVPPRPGH